MNRTRFLLPAALALGACFVPSASIEPTSSSSTGGASSGGAGGAGGADPNAWTPSVKGPISFGASDPPRPAIAPTGNPMQRHLVHASGRWYAFYLLGQRLFASYFDEFDTWRPTGDGISLHANYPFDDGRVFGVALNPSDAGEVHFTADWPSGGLHVTGRAPASETPATPFVFGASVSRGVPSGVAVDGAVTALGPGGTIYDFGSFLVNGQACTSCVARFTPMTGWTTKPLDFGMKMAGQLPRGALSLDNTPVVAWPLVGGLAQAHITDGAESWSGAEIPSTTQVKPVDRTWAMCTKQVGGSMTHDAHALVHDGAKFAHYFTNSGSWSVFPGGELLSPPNTTKLHELFLACNADYLYAFSVDDSNAVVGARYIVSEQVWSSWTVLVPGASAQGQRCFLSGAEQVTPGEVGLIWSDAAAGCDAKGLNTYYALFVRIG